MNYKIALSAAFFAALGLTGCDNDNKYGRNDRAVDVTSGTSAAAPAQADLNTGLNNRLGSGNEEMSDIRETSEAREARMRQRKVAPAYDETHRASDSANNDRDVYHSDDVDDDAVVDDQDEVLSGSTSEPMDETKTSYSQTNLPGGMTAKDRNLRYGLIGNGTGMGLEDTTSKFMTDNYTLSDPTISNHAQINTGALSAPTEDQDALKDIKSGTSFEPNNYYIDED